MGASECIARNDRAGLERLLALLCPPAFCPRAHRAGRGGQRRAVGTPPPCSGFSPISTSPRHRRGSARYRDRRSMPCRTGRPWHNRYPSTSSTSKRSGKPLPLPARPRDAHFPAPRLRQIVSHARSAPSGGVRWRPYRRRSPSARAGRLPRPSRQCYFAPRSSRPCWLDTDLSIGLALRFIFAEFR